MARVKEFFSKNPTAWEFAKYTIFSVIGGLLELVVFMILNLFAAKRYKQAINWFIFVYLKGRTGRFIAFIVSSVIGQAMKFIPISKRLSNPPTIFS